MLSIERIEQSTLALTRSRITEYSTETSSASFRICEFSYLTFSFCYRELE